MRVRYEDLMARPFVYGGRTPDGLDCWGLVLELYAREGIVIPDIFVDDPEHWGRDGDGEIGKFIQDSFKDWLLIDPRAIDEGDVLCFSRFGKAPDHAGVAINNRMFVQALEGSGVCLADRLRSPYPDYYRGAYRYVGHHPTHQ